eukprot:Sspe_Gene.22103::Locus_8357_Transcript_1_1_Confidence_1.000_Length_909::g.22103::m.22103
MNPKDAQSLLQPCTDKLQQPPYGSAPVDSFISPRTGIQKILHDAAFAWWLRCRKVTFVPVPDGAPPLPPGGALRTREPPPTRAKVRLQDPPATTERPLMLPSPPPSSLCSPSRPDRSWQAMLRSAAAPPTDLPPPPCNMANMIVQACLEEQQQQAAHAVSEPPPTPPSPDRPKPRPKRPSVPPPCTSNRPHRERTPLYVAPPVKERPLKKTVRAVGRAVVVRRRVGGLRGYAVAMAALCGAVAAAVPCRMEGRDGDEKEGEEEKEEDEKLKGGEKK